LDLYLDQFYCSSPIDIVSKLLVSPVTGLFYVSVYLLSCFLYFIYLWHIVSDILTKPVFCFFHFDIGHMEQYFTKNFQIISCRSALWISLYSWFFPSIIPFICCVSY